MTAASAEIVAAPCKPSGVPVTALMSGSLLWYL